MTAVSISAPKRVMELTVDGQAVDKGLGADGAFGVVAVVLLDDCGA